jgi:hypothetical protein
MAEKEEFVTALEDLYLPGSRTLAHLKGGQVPRENVEVNGWSELVASPTTKAAKEASGV